MLEKESGHPVFPMDWRDVSSLNLHQKQTDDVLTECRTLFPLSMSPYPLRASISKSQKAYLKAVPNKRFKPLCQICGR